MPHKNLDERKAWQAKHYEENKNEILSRNKEYRQRNKEKIREWKSAYESQPHRQEKHRRRGRQHYNENKELYKTRARDRRRERKAFIDEICLRYGCQNPGCKWEGQLEPYQLTFHHVDPSQKEIEVAKMHSWSYEKIVAEINKCIVLCRNCHPLADRGLIVITENMMCREVQ